jgi:hypothetical protein
VHIYIAALQESESGGKLQFIPRPSFVFWVKEEKQKGRERRELFRKKVINSLLLFF